MITKKNNPQSNDEGKQEENIRLKKPFTHLNLTHPRRSVPDMAIITLRTVMKEVMSSKMVEIMRT